MHVDHLQRLAAATGYASQWIFSNYDRNTCLFHQQAVEVTQQRTTTGQNHTALGDIGSQFRRALLEGNHDGANNAGQRLLQRFEDFVGVQGKATWNAFCQVTAAHFDLAHFVTRVSRTDFVLNTLCGGFTDQRAVVTANVIDDGFVEAVTTDTYGRGVNHTVQRDNGHFSGTATDIHHHGAGRFGNRQAGTNSCSHRLFNQEDFTRTSALSGFTNSTTLYLCSANRHTHQNTWAWTHKAVAVHLFDKVLKHFLGHEEVSDNAVFHRSNGSDITRRTTKHLLSVMADGRYAFR